MRSKLSVVRLPASVARSTMRRLNEIGDFMARALIFPSDDTPKLMSQIASTIERIQRGERVDFIERLKSRAENLQLSSDTEDLIAAAELLDMANELSEEMHEDEDTEKEEQDVEH